MKDLRFIHALSIGALALGVALAPACSCDDDDDPPTETVNNDVNNDDNNTNNDTDLCADVTCDAGETCNTANGECEGEADPCDGVTCDTGETCNATTGECEGGENPDIATCKAACVETAGCTELADACAQDQIDNFAASCDTACEDDMTRPQILAVAGLDCATKTGLVISNFGLTCGPGTPCEQYCALTQANCTDANELYADDAACMTACMGFADDGTDGDTAGDTVQCRIYHAGVAEGDPGTHCPHAGIDGAGVCVDDTTPTLCDTYCDLATANCTGGNLLYTTDADCQAACANFQMDGTDGDTEGDSVQCRIYHAGDPAAADGGLHCPHASPNGGGVCVDPAATACQRMCATSFENCGDQFAHADIAACETSCENTPVGTLGDDTGDTVQCRLTYANAAGLADNNIAECLAAGPNGGGLCTNDADPYVVDRMGRPGINTALVLAENKDAFNARAPGEHVYFEGEMEFFLGAYDSLDGDPADALLNDNRAGLAALLANDWLSIDVSIDDCAGGYLALETGVAANCGGRTLEQDVMDTTLQALVGNGPNDDIVVTDNIDADDQGFSTEFPYLSAPQ